MLIFFLPSLIRERRSELAEPLQQRIDVIREKAPPHEGPEAVTQAHQKAADFLHFYYIFLLLHSPRRLPPLS